jgi:hypothetical protein
VPRISAAITRNMFCFLDFLSTGTQLPDQLSFIA